MLFSASLATVMFASKWKKKGVGRAQRRADARKEHRDGTNRPKLESLPLRLKTPPGTPGTVCRHPTLADLHMRQPVSHAALNDSRWDDSPLGPERVPSAMSWNAAVEGKGSVAYRALNSDLSWLTDQSTLAATVSTGPPLHPQAKVAKGRSFKGGGQGATPYWLQGEPTIVEDR